MPTHDWTHDWLAHTRSRSSRRRGQWGSRLRARMARFLNCWETSVPTDGFGDWPSPKTTDIIMRITSAPFSGAILILT